MKNKQEKFSIRKFNNGVASVLVATMIGATPIISAVTSVSANEVNNTIKTEYTITIIRTLNGQRQIPEEIKLPHGTNLNEEIPKRYRNAQYSWFTSPDIQDLSKPLDKDGTIIVEYDVIEAESSTYQARVEYVLENSSSNTPPFKRKTLVDSGRIFDTISTTYNINIYDPTNGKYFVNENEITKPYSTVSDRKESTIKVDISEGKLRPEILEEKGKTYQFVKIQEGSSEVYEFSNNKSGTRKTVYVYREINPSTIKPNTDTDNAQPLTLTVTHRYDFGELIETKTDIEPGTVLPIKAWGNDWDGKNTQNDRVPDRRNYIRSPYINMTVNGEKVKTGSEITINENTNVVIQYGDTPMIEVLRQSIPFKTIYKEDITLENGKTVVEREGQEGVSEDYGGAINIREQAVDKIIRIGTKPTVKTEVIPFDTVYEKDETLDKGVEKVVQEGKNGERVNGKVTKEPVKKIIKIGTKEKTTQVASSPKQETSNNKEEKKSEPAKETPNTNSGTSSIIGLISSLIGLGTFYKKKND